MTPPPKNFPLKTDVLDGLEYGLADIVKARLAGQMPSPAPYLVHMLGIPGAGKTTLAMALHYRLSSSLHSKPLRLGFDEIMASIPGYADEADPVAAHARYEQPARTAGYALLKEALTRRFSILFDHGGANHDHIKILEFAKNELGYKTAVVHISCEPQIAKARIEKRTLEDSRHTPPHYIDERSALIEKLLPAYRDRADAFFTADNSHFQLETEKICEAVAKAVT